MFTLCFFCSFSAVNCLISPISSTTCCPPLWSPTRMAKHLCTKEWKWFCHILLLLACVPLQTVLSGAKQLRPQMRIIISCLKSHGCNNRTEKVQPSADRRMCMWYAYTFLYVLVQHGNQGPIFCWGLCSTVCAHTARKSHSALETYGIIRDGKRCCYCLALLSWQKFQLLLDISLFKKMRDFTESHTLMKQSQTMTSWLPSSI